MTGATKELDFLFYLILMNLNGNLWQVATMWDRAALYDFSTLKFVKIYFIIKHLVMFKKWSLCAKKNVFSRCWVQSYTYVQ